MTEDAQEMWRYRQRVWNGKFEKAHDELCGQRGATPEEITVCHALADAAEEWFLAVYKNARERGMSDRDAAQHAWESVGWW